MSSGRKIVKRALTIVAAISLVAGFYYYGWGPCGKSEVRKAASQYSKVLVRWKEAVDVVPEIPRSALGVHLAQLRAVREDLSSITAPECMTRWHNQLDTHMGEKLDELQEFADGGGGISLDAQAMKSLRVRLTSFVNCAPKCPAKVLGGEPVPSNRIVQLKTRGGAR